jgi:hypothetical protein
VKKSAESITPAVLYPGIDNDELLERTKTLRLKGKHIASTYIGSNLTL